MAATTEDTAQTAIDLRWQGHKFQAQNICLNNRHEDTIARLQGRGDRETRHALLSLLKESKAMNGALAGHLALMSNANQGLVDILQKSKDGGAALTMRRAAELLVKVRVKVEVVHWYQPPHSHTRTSGFATVNNCCLASISP